VAPQNQPLIAENSKKTNKINKAVAQNAPSLFKMGQTFGIGCEGRRMTM
jgi:hypothetical protein